MFCFMQERAADIVIKNWLGELPVLREMVPQLDKY
jgi:hypothetical protein